MCLGKNTRYIWFSGCVWGKMQRTLDREGYAKQKDKPTKTSPGKAAAILPVLFLHPQKVRKLASIRVKCELMYYLSGLKGSYIFKLYATLLTMRILFILLTFCSWTISFGQTTQNNDSLKLTEFPLRVDGIKLDKFTTDTLHLGQFCAKKVIAYKFQEVTFYVDYNDYIKSLKVFWKRYKEGMKYGKEAKEKGEYVNPEYEPRWLVIDSIYQTIKKQSKKQDTIYLTQKTFDKVGLRSLMDFDVQIEKGNCAIYNHNNILQTTIIRQKGSWYRGPLAAWGGRRYFLLGATNFFYEATDWIS